MSRSRKRILISYSHDSPEHRAKVLQLADSLRHFGLANVHLDQYQQGDPPEGWPLWMETQIESAETVLLICTETYFRRVRKQEEPGIGRGVCWEANLIYAELYESQTKSNKFIPVILRNEDRPFVPKPLGANSVFLVDDNAGFERLYRHLTGQSHRQQPRSGELVQLALSEPLPLFGLPTPLPVDSETEPPPKSPELPKPGERSLLPNVSPPSRFEVRELDWYEEADAAYFHGRETDIKALRTLLLDQPVVRLFGPSGVGKSSLLRAGLLPALRKLNWRIAVVRPFDHPEVQIPRQISEQLLTAASPALSAKLELATLQSELAPVMAAENTSMLFLLIDQVEDVVSPLAPPEARESLVEFLKQVWEADAAARPNIRVLVAYRTDADTRLGSLWKEVSGDPSGLPYHTIQGLSRDAAKRIIEEAIQNVPTLSDFNIEEVIAELEHESSPLDCSGDIFPPYLQMVLTRMLSTDRNDSVEATGSKRVRGLIGDYLHQELQRLEAQDGDFLKCRAILEALSRSSGQKLSLSLGELTAEVRLSPEAMAPLMSELHRARLIRPVGNNTWEIQHDRLAEVVIAEMADTDREAKAARELLAAKAINHSLTGAWLEPAELHLLCVHRKSLHLSHRERYLILGSLLRKQDKHAYRVGWMLLDLSNTENTLRLLRELTSDADTSVRVAAIRGLGSFMIEEDLPRLRELTNDPDADIRESALEAVGEYVLADDLPMLREIASSKYGITQVAALKAIGKHGIASDLPMLRDLANDKYGVTNEAAIAAIGMFDHTVAVPVLQDLIKSKDSEVRDRALQEIVKSGTADVLPLLRELVRDDDLSIRHTAIHAIGTYGSAEDAPLLNDLVGDYDRYIAHAAVKAIGKLPAEVALPLLRPIARNGTLELCRTAIRLLGEFARQDDLPLLRSLLRHKSSFVREAAVEAIGKIRLDDDLPVLRELARKKDARVRMAAVAALGRYSHLDDLPLLKEAVRDKVPEVRQKAVLAIGAFARVEDLSLLREIACNKYLNAQDQAVEAIGMNRSVDAIALLRELCRIGHGRGIASRLLSENDDRENLSMWFFETFRDLPVDVVAQLDYFLFCSTD